MRKVLYILLLLAFYSSFLGAQDVEKTEKKAKKFFNKAYYEEAMPYLNKLIQYKEKDPYINYMYAVSSIETGNPVPNKAYQAIKYALDSHVDEYDIDYYWGRANEELFKTKQAIQIYTKIAHNPNTDKRIKELVDKRLQACQEAVTLHQNIVQNILWQREATYQTFYKLYDFDTQKYGNLILTPEELNSGNSETDLAYIPPSKDFIYFAKYDKKTKSKDLYRAPINSQGEFGEAEKLNYYINGESDEEFPALTGNLSVLYFTSNGHHSIGKQDIFRSTYSMSGDWSKPTHLGLPVNSPFNDFALFFLPDQGIAYFTSDRYHDDGKLTVYKVKLNPRISALLNRTFYTAKTDDTPQSPAETIVQKDSTAVADTTADSTLAAAPEKALSAKENALRIINNKKKINRMVDSAFFFANQWKEKTTRLTNQKDQTVHIAYNKGKQSKALYRQYLDLCQKVNEESDPKKLQDDQASLNTKFKDAALAVYQAEEASKLKTEIAKAETISQKITDTLNVLSGAMQLDAAAERYNKVHKNYDIIKQILQQGDTLHTYAGEIQSIKNATDAHEQDLLSMDRFCENKIQIINAAVESQMLDDEEYLQSTKDIHELMNMAIISHKKLINTSSSAKQKKYLSNDIVSFATKAINEQQKEIDRLTEIVNDLREQQAYAEDEIAGMDNENTGTDEETLPPANEENTGIVNSKETKKNVEETKLEKQETNIADQETDIATESTHEEVVATTGTSGNEEDAGLQIKDSGTDSEGIRYKVQLGAYGTGTKLDKFSGVPELSKEEIPGKSLFRLFSGNYSSYKAAEQAKNELRASFPGAFVVAFESGKKIPVSTALQKQSLSQASGTQENAGEVAQTKIPESIVPQKGETVAGKYKTNVKQNSGKLYYIQLGTFGQPKVSAQLYNISPLLYEILPNGLFRYFTGPYKNIEEARAAVNTIRAKGASGAFVVGYNNGEKMHLDNPVPPPSQKSIPAQTGEISYEIQLGAFSKAKSAIWLKDMQQRTGTAIHKHTTPSGIHIYTAGSFASREEADNYKKDLTNKGFSGIFVVAFRDGEKVPLH